MQQINFDEYKNRLQSYLEHKDLEFNMYLQDYSTRYPPPEKEEVLKENVYPSFKFWLAVTAGICAVGASGLRVYDRIYQVAINSGSSQILASAESWFALGAVNIGLVALAFTFAYKKRKVTNTSLFVGLIVAAIISLIAGLGQSFYGLGIDKTDLSWVTQSFDWILAITLAAITGLEWVSGDMAGVEMVDWEVSKENAKKKYDDNLKKSDEKYDREYKEWLKIARQQFGLWKAQFSTWQEKNYNNTLDIPLVEEIEKPVLSRKDETKFRKQDGRTTEEQKKQIPSEVSNILKNSTSKDFIVSMIEKISLQTGNVPGVTDICKYMAENELPEKYKKPEYINEYIKSKKGYVSKTRKEYLETNSGGN